MSKIQWIRPCLIMLLFGSLNGATWAEAKDEATENMTALTENSAGVAASGAALDPMAVDVNTLLARQPTGKMIDRLNNGCWPSVAVPSRWARND